jgi:dTDP-4-amino-4,6-dideoxygalactose transaminase
MLRSRPLADAAERVCGDLGARLGSDRVDLFASGRESLRVALRILSEQSRREEVIVPAYTCYSVASAVVAAGLRVRLVDVDARGRIDPERLAELPLERAAAVVVCNLFGLAEPIAETRTLAEAHGVAVVDDAAQALGARDSGGPIGGRGDVGVLSFSRGKPLAALGGGALAWKRPPADLPHAPNSEHPRPLRALLEAAAHDLVLSSWIFRVVAAIPAFHVGETRFEPSFQQGGIGGAALVLTASALAGLDGAGSTRARRAQEIGRRIAAETPFEPLLESESNHGVYPRLAVLAPDVAAREGAMGQLDALGAGASRFYPASLDQVEPLQPHLAEPANCPRARELAARVFTLPTHGRGGSAWRLDVIQSLADYARNHAR